MDLFNILVWTEDNFDYTLYFEQNEVTITDVNKFILAIAGISSIEFPTEYDAVNYRRFLKKFDNVNINAPLDLSKERDKSSRKAEQVIDALTCNLYDSIPDNCFNQMIHFLEIMSKAENEVLQETAGYVALIMLRVLAPRRGDVVRNVRSSPHEQVLAVHEYLNRVFEMLLNVLKRSILLPPNNVIFVTRRLTQLIGSNQHLIAFDQTFGFYTELFTIDTKTVLCLVLDSLKNLLEDTTMDENTKESVTDYLVRILDVELEQLLWDRSPEVVKKTFILVIAMQRLANDLIYSECSTIRIFRKIFDKHSEVRNLAVTFMKLTAQSEFILTFALMLLNCQMLNTADIKKAIDPIWHMEEVQDLDSMARILRNRRSPDFKSSYRLMLVKIMVYVVEKIYSECIAIASTEPMSVDNDSSNPAMDKIETFLRSLPDLLYDLAECSQVFIALLPVLDVFDANFFESKYSDNQNYVDKILNTLGETGGLDYFKTFMIYMILKKLAKKSESIQNQVHKFIGEVTRIFIGSINYMRDTSMNASLGGSINYAELSLQLLNLAAMSEWFKLRDFMENVDDLKKFQGAIVTDLMSNRLDNPIENGYLISLIIQLKSYNYEESLNTTNRDKRAVIMNIKSLISIAKWFETQFFGREECDAFLAMQIVTASCEILLRFSSPLISELSNILPNIENKIKNSLDEEYIDCLASFIARIGFATETLPVQLIECCYKNRMLECWNLFQTNYEDFKDFGASCKLLEHYDADEPSYAANRLYELVEILFKYNNKFFCQSFSNIFATLTKDARRTERIEAVTKKLLKQLQEFAVVTRDAELVSRTVAVILKYVIVDLEANDEDNPCAILDCLHSLVQPVKAMHRKVLFKQLQIANEKINFMKNADQMISFVGFKKLLNQN